MEDVTSISWIFIIFVCFIDLIELGRYKVYIINKYVIITIVYEHVRLSIYVCEVAQVSSYSWNKHSH